MIKLKTRGDFKNTYKFFDKAQHPDYASILAPFGQEGVSLLSAGTPIDSGRTANSWDYHIEQGVSSVKIVWTNHNLTKDGQSIAILLQYGHGTGTGGYVLGRDYINPSMRPLFDKIEQEAWKAVISI